MVLLPRSVQSQQKPSSPAFGAKRSTSTTLAPSARSGVWGGKTKIMGDSQMSDQKRVKIKYKPRDQFRAFHNRKQRWSVLVCHRRAGKTVATLNDLIRGAVNECKPEGRYAFIFPQRNQAKDTAWRYLRRYAEPLLAKPPNESELRVDLINGSMVRLYGADNPDALRGPSQDEYDKEEADQDGKEARRQRQGGHLAH